MGHLCETSRVPAARRGPSPGRRALPRLRGLPVARLPDRPQRAAVTAHLLDVDGLADSPGGAALPRGADLLAVDVETLGEGLARLHERPAVQDALALPLHRVPAAAVPAPAQPLPDHGAAPEHQDPEQDVGLADVSAEG